MVAPVPILDPTIGNAPRSNRRIPVALRLFVAILTLLGLGSTVWVGVAGYRQHEAILAVEDAGGTVLTERAGPYWLRQQVGDERLMALEAVDFFHLWRDETTDDDVRLVRRLPNVQRIEIRARGVTDAGVAYLKELTNLRDLDICGTRVTDDGLANLAGLTTLERLNLGVTKISDRGLVYLYGLKNLKEINLNGSEVTSNGIDELKRALPGLKVFR
jgi:hypothetical protein